MLPLSAWSNYAVIRMHLSYVRRDGGRVWLHKVKGNNKMPYPRRPNLVTKP